MQHEAPVGEGGVCALAGAAGGSRGPGFLVPVSFFLLFCTRGHLSRSKDIWVPDSSLSNLPQT